MFLDRKTFLLVAFRWLKGPVDRPICMHQEMDHVIPRIGAAIPPPTSPSVRRSSLVRSRNCSPKKKIVCGAVAAVASESIIALIVRRGGRGPGGGAHTDITDPARALLRQFRCRFTNSRIGPKSVIIKRFPLAF